MAVATKLRAQRADILMKAKAIVNGESYTAEDGAKVDAMFADADAIQTRIEQAERADLLTAGLDSEIARVADATGFRPSVVVNAAAEAKALEKRLFLSFALGNPAMLSDADRAIMAARERAAIQAAGTTATPASGGYTIAPDFMAEMLIAQAAYGGMRAVSRSVPTTTGVDMPWPTMDDTANVATIVGENTAGVAGTDLAFGSKTLKAWMYRSGYLAIPLELLQDSAFDFDTLVRDALAERFARGQNAHFTTGNGTTQPQGISIGGALGKTGTTGQVTTVIPDDLIDLEHSVDPAYRKGARFMMHDTTVKAIRKLKDLEDRPLFMPSYANGGGADTILGYPNETNQAVAVMAASAKSIFFGNFRNYVIRDVMAMRMTRLNERFAENGQVAFIAFQRTDGRLVSAAAPLKWYANPAS
jgi:HK97 family phage major capsid protein